MRLASNTISNVKSSFLSCEKDAEIIIRKLLVDTGADSAKLKKLLVINTKDCLENNSNYDTIVKNTSIGELIEKQYITLVPKLKFEEHEEVRSRIIISFDNFVPNGTNPEFRDCVVSFDIICHTDYWDLGNYRLRPLKIAGYIDGILNNSKLTGIGTFQFMGCNELILNEELAGYTLMFSAVHGSDDVIAPEE